MLSFAPPTPNSLKHYTENLIAILRKTANAYRPPGYESLCEGIKELKANYKARKKSSFNNDRLRQIDLLVETLAHLSPNTPEVNHSILLGAVIYRYIRLKRIRNKAFGTNRLFRNENCTLSDLLGEILKVDSPSPLDSLTISTSYSTYYRYLMANNNYKSYSYIVNSPDYLEKLQEKIACYNDPHAQLLQKLENFAQFIISLAQQLQSIEEEIKRVVERVFLYLDLESQSTDILLALRNAGGRSEIIQFLKSINQTSAEAIMQEPEYRITIENKEATQMALLDNVATVSHFALVGGYLLVLKELEAVAGETIALQNVLLRGLGVSEENLIDKHSSELALRQLWAFTNEVPGLLDTKKLSVEAWISPEVCYSRINWQYINQEVFYQSQIDVRRDEESNAKDDINTFIST